MYKLTLALFIVIQVLNFALAGTICGTAICSSSQKCCQDNAYGNTCYDPKKQQCLTSGTTVTKLCNINQAICSDYCFDITTSDCYVTINGGQTTCLKNQTFCGGTYCYYSDEDSCGLPDFVPPPTTTPKPTTPAPDSTRAPTQAPTPATTTAAPTIAPTPAPTTEAPVPASEAPSTPDPSSVPTNPSPTNQEGENQARSGATKLTIIGGFVFALIAISFL
jgi:hypothetical protein